MSDNFLVKQGDKAEWGVPEGYPKIEKAFEDIVWDGNTDGLISISMVGSIFYKIAEPIEFDKMIGAEITIEINSVEDTFKLNKSNLYKINEQLYSSEMFVVALAPINLDGLKIKEPGFYVPREPNIYIKSIRSRVVTVISSEFLPTSVPIIESASVGQVPKIAAVDKNGIPTKWEASEVKSYSEESWTFTLEDDSTVTKKVAILK